MTVLHFLPAIIALLAVFSVMYYKRRVAILRKKLQDAERNSAEIGSFMSLFSKNIRSVRESANWMNVTARYVADAIHASIICIFSMKDDMPVITGSSGNVPRSMRFLMEAGGNPAGIQNSENSEAVLKLLQNVISQREAVLLDDPHDPQLVALSQNKDVRSMMLVPISSDGMIQGILCAVNSNLTPKRTFDNNQFGRLRFLSNQVILAFNIMEVYSVLSKQQRISQELEFARSLQRSLLPPSIPVWGNMTIQAFTRASKEVSGDFYDVVEVDENRLLVVIGDACGKGIPACMIMAMTRSFIRANISRFTTMKSLLTELNDNLYRDMGDGRYITLGICLLNRKESTMEYARAGHTELLMYTHGHTRTINPDGAGLGLLPGEIAEVDTFCIELTPGIEMLLFTDGINEATNPAGEYFDVRRIKSIFLKSCIEQDDPHDTIARIMGAVDDFSQAKSQADDQTIVIIRHL